MKDKERKTGNNAFDVFFLLVAMIGLVVDNCRNRVVSPLTSGSKRATPESSDLMYENIGLPVELHMSTFQMNDQILLGISLPAICIVFKIKQNRAWKGTFDSFSFGQASAVRNEDSRYETAVVCFCVMSVRRERYF